MARAGAPRQFWNVGVQRLESGIRSREVVYTVVATVDVLCVVVLLPVGLAANLAVVVSRLEVLRAAY